MSIRFLVALGASACAFLYLGLMPPLGFPLELIVVLIALLCLLLLFTRRSHDDVEYTGRKPINHPDEWHSVQCWFGDN